MKGTFELNKLKESVAALEHALTFLGEVKREPVYHAAITKNFEVCLEYAWKFLKRRVIEEGFDPASPREAIKLAGRVGLIADVEKWLDYLEDRNEAVHDYLGVSDEEYLTTIQEFFVDAKRLLA